MVIKKQYANDFGFAFNKDLNGNHLPNFGIGVNPNNRKYNINQRIINMSPDGWYAKYGGLPSTGFREEFLDKNRDFDQTHHFSAIFWTTAHLSFVAGANEAFYLDLGNEGDINLGRQATFAFYDNAFWKSPSSWIRMHLGN